MENPFEILNTRLQRIEDAIDRLTAAIGALPQQPEEPDSYDRRKPATRQMAADYLGVSTATIYNLVRSKQLKACKVGRAIRFRWEALDEFIQKRNK